MYLPKIIQNGNNAFRFILKLEVLTTKYNFHFNITGYKDHLLIEKRKAWAWEAQNDMEAADREGLQRVEALGYQPSW